MSQIYTYGTLYSALQVWNEDFSTDFQNQLPDIIQKGELRMLRDLDLDNLDVQLSTPPINQLTSTVTKPQGLIRDRVVSLIYGPNNPNNTALANANTLLLCHFDNGNGSQVFTDSSGHGNAINSVTSVPFGSFSAGGATQSSTQAKFGPSSFVNNNDSGTNWHNAQIPVTVGGLLDLTYLPAWTIEFWVYPVQNTFTAFQVYPDGGFTNPLGAIQVNSLEVEWVGSTGSGYAGSTGNANLMTQNAWNHVAIVYANNEITVYVNGIGSTPGPNTGAIYHNPTNWAMYFGQGISGEGGSPNEIYAYQDELRISATAVYTGNFAPPTAPFSVGINPAGLPQISTLRKRSNDFVMEYLVANGQNLGPPEYYAEYDPNTWVVAPNPDQQYALSVRGIYPPPLLGDNDQVNAPAAIVALQHTVANTVLTLTTSPYVPPEDADESPGQIQVALTSSGNMSANAFTVVGLDSDGNALTSTIAGPNAGTVYTPEFFTSVTSITPSVTDGVNLVSAGYLSNNTSWLSTRYADVLFFSCLVDACQFLKRFSARAVAQNEYNGRLVDAQTQIRLLKRSDLDDLFINRQLANGPGMGPPEMPPAAAGAQQPSPGV